MPSPAPSLDVLATNINALRAEGREVEARRLTAQLLARIEPTLRRRVARFTRDGRGTLDREDLLQYAQLLVLQRLPGFDSAKGCFPMWVSFQIKSALADYVRLNCGDVHVPQGVKRPRVASTGGLNRAASGEDPETLVADAEQIAVIRRRVYALKPQWREVVCEYYGIGRPRRSDREVAKRLGVNRTALARVRAAALAELSTGLT